MGYRNSQKSKSRSKLWNAARGVSEIVGAAGVGANWTILLNSVADTDTLQIGPYYFEFDSAGEAAGTSAGTAADPHLVDKGASTTEAATALAAALIAETTTTGAWGFLNPVNSVGASSSTATVTINFFPGTFANAATYIPDATFVGTDPTITNVSDGTVPKYLSSDVKWNLIDTTGSGQNKEYYYLGDGKSVGEEAAVMVTTFASGDTPTIIGHLSDQGVAQVEALFTTAEPGMSAQFLWTGAAWELVAEGNGTALTFDAAT